MAAVHTQLAPQPGTGTGARPLAGKVPMLPGPGAYNGTIFGGVYADENPGAQLAADASIKNSVNNARTADYQARLGLLGQQYTADTGAASNRYNTDAATNQFNTRLNFARDRYNQLFPMIQGQFANSQGGIGSGGVGGPGPNIDTGGIYSDQQIGQKVNEAQAANEQRGATSYRQAQRDLGGRGLGTSPLLQAIQQNLAIGTQAANAASARDIPLQYGAANADQRFRSQSAASEAYGQRQQEDIERQKNRIAANDGLLQALVSLANFNI